MNDFLRPKFSCLVLSFKSRLNYFHTIFLGGCANADINWPHFHRPLFALFKLELLKPVCGVLSHVSVLYSILTNLFARQNSLSGEML